jgi:hypothetical protein
MRVTITEELWASSCKSCGATDRPLARLTFAWEGETRTGDETAWPQAKHTIWAQLCAACLQTAVDLASPKEGE